MEGRREDELFSGLSAEGWAPGWSQVRSNRQVARGSSSFLFFLVLHLCLAVSISHLGLSLFLCLSPSPLPAQCLSLVSSPPHHLQVHLGAQGHLGACHGGSRCIAQPRLTRRSPLVLTPGSSSCASQACLPWGTVEPLLHIPASPLSLGLRTVAPLSAVCPGSLWSIWKLLKS